VDVALITSDRKTTRRAESNSTSRQDESEGDGAGFLVLVKILLRFGR